MINNSCVPSVRLFIFTQPPRSFPTHSSDLRFSVRSWDFLVTAATGFRKRPCDRVPAVLELYTRSRSPATFESSNPNHNASSPGSRPFHPPNPKPIGSTPICNRNAIPTCRPNQKTPKRKLRTCKGSGNPHLDHFGWFFFLKFSAFRCRHQGERFADFVVFVG